MDGWRGRACGLPWEHSVRLVHQATRSGVAVTRQNVKRCLPHPRRLGRVSRANGGGQVQHQWEAGGDGRMVPSRSSSWPRPVTQEPPALRGPVMRSFSQVGGYVGNAGWACRLVPVLITSHLLARVLWAGESWVSTGETHLHQSSRAVPIQPGPRTTIRAQWGPGTIAQAEWPQCRRSPSSYSVPGTATRSLHGPCRTEPLNTIHGWQNRGSERENNLCQVTWWGACQPEPLAGSAHSTPRGFQLPRKALI